ncbi:hypothetical protein XELAEV_18040263mg [Xenopus laevis]|uniref:Receptor ligand binding region domain-containing protein n=1 Tax=Xenopus laevis TaxID=8355 RepID=A0A974CAA9_XENLA|nr:hypothetical protein XELAEV_18040263mg [Xenopus laevis]
MNIYLSYVYFCHLHLFVMLLWYKDCECKTSLEGCRLSTENVIGYSLAGDITLGGLFPVHTETIHPALTYKECPQPLLCSGFHIRFYRFLLAMVFAILKINASDKLLPNITLGFKLYDSCYSEGRSLRGATRILSGEKNGVPNFNCNKDHMPLAIIGDMLSKASVPLARILGLYRYPQISYAAGLPLLSDKIEFPSFLRTTYSIDYESFVIAQLVKYFNWTWVGLICSDNDLGTSGAQLLTREIEKNGGCIAFQEALPIFPSIKSIYRIIGVIEKSRATVIILCCTIENLVSLMEQISFHNISEKVWMGTTGWSTSDFPRRDILTTLNGSLGLAVQTGKIPGFREFLYSIHPSIFLDDPFMKTFWENAFHCVWPENDVYNYTSQGLLDDGSVWCTGEERLDSIDVNIYDVYNFKYTYNVHNAVFAVAHALHQMNNCVPGKGPFKNGSCAQVHNHQPRQLLHYIKKVVFNNTAGDQIYFDENGDVPIYVDILNWQLFPNGSNQYVHIGIYDASSPKGQELKIWLNKILWYGGYSHDFILRSFDRTIALKSFDIRSRRILIPSRISKVN